MLDPETYNRSASMLQGAALLNGFRQVAAVEMKSCVKMLADVVPRQQFGCLEMCLCLPKPRPPPVAHPPECLLYVPCTGTAVVGS